MVPLVLSLVLAAPPEPALPAEVGAVLRKRCGECHGEKDAKAKLTLTTPAGLARGGRKGPVVRPGKPDASRLWEVIDADEMPPDEPLGAAERKVLREWIANGAAGLPTANTETHWAFRPVVRPPVPEVAAFKQRVANPIDAFILAKLHAAKLTPAPPADRLTLVRRVAFDLTGLPPTPAETDAFTADTTPDAYAKMVDRYLASPRYGERWGKHWMDATGYADSNGYFSADSDRPLAWKYRDYVIRSFNADKPLDRFVREQIAGDELAGYVPGGEVTPAMAELLVATHLLRNAPDGTGESDGNPDELLTERLTVREGAAQVVMNGLLGITIQCARCHAHKFEPIGHDEYYRLQAILAPAYDPARWLKPNDRAADVGPPAAIAEYYRRSAQFDRQVKALKDGLAAMAVPYKERLVEELLPTGLGRATRDAVLTAVRTPKASLTAEQRALVTKHVDPLKITEDDIARRFAGFASLRDEVNHAIVSADQERPAAPERVSFIWDAAGPPPKTHLLARGLHNRPGAEVEPGVPAALTLPGNPYTVAKAAGGTGRRLALARWVTSPENPLFARVYVNRVWQHHFGRGIVATPDNLGLSGAEPTHPELLDWLAAEFVSSGYSVKHLHRLVLNSAAYRQASAAPRPSDPDNLLLARFPLRRLDAESIRDAMLAVSGELDLRAGGPYTPVHRTTEGDVEADEKHPGVRRRAVYLQQRRSYVPTFLALFDAPSIAVTCGVRPSSTIPLQALALLNGDFTRRRAAALAARVTRDAGEDDDTRLTLALRLVYGRPPHDGERAAAAKFLATQRPVYAGKPDADARAWADLCQMLLASNAFLYVE